MTLNLPLYKNFGTEDDSVSQDLKNQLSQMYTDIANSLTFVVKKNVVSGADPSASASVNALFSVGDITVRTDTNAVWVMTARTTPEAVTWTLVS